MKNQKLELLSALTFEELGQQLFTKLSAGYLLKKFKINEDSVSAIVAYPTDESKPVAEMTDSELEAHFKNEDKKRMLNDFGLGNL